MSADVEAPIPGLARRQLHLFYLLDVSASMGVGGKIAALNDAMRTVMPMLKDEVSKPDRQHVEMLVRIITFSSGARWHLQTPTRIEDCQDWESLEAGGVTDLGQALELLSDALKNTMPRRALPPCVVLISDGQPTDDWEHGMGILKQLPWFRKLVRVGIAMGDDANKEVIEDFTGNMEMVLPAQNRDQFIAMLRWASTTITTLSSTGLPAGTSADEDGPSIPAIPPPPPEIVAPTRVTGSSTDVTW